MRLSVKIALYFTGAILFSGCAQNLATLEEASAEATSSVATPARFKSSYLKGRVKDGWLRTFRDSTLNYLVREAQKNNPDLKIASANVSEALAYMNMSLSNFAPTMDILGSYQFRNWEANRQHDIGNGVLSISWEPDLWGKVANDVEAKRETTLSYEYLYEWARQSLSASTAKAWFLLGSDKMIIDFYKQVVKIQKEAQNTLKKRADIGQGNSRDVAVSAGMLAEAQEALEKAKQSYKQDIRALETLIGRYPAGKLRGKYLKARFPRVPSGVPLSLLDRRPDVIAAKYQVASAFHNKEATRLLRLPSIKIGGQVGVDVVRDAIAKLIGSLFMPVFDAGKIQAKIDAASAKEQRAIANYKKVVLKAYKEVENALSNERYLQKRYIYLNKMVREYKRAYDMTYKNYKIGQGNILDVLNIQSKWITAKIARTQLLKERLINRVNLFLALGGKF